MTGLQLIEHKYTSVNSPRDLPCLDWLSSITTVYYLQWLLITVNYYWMICVTWPCYCWTKCYLIIDCCVISVLILLSACFYQESIILIICIYDNNTVLNIALYRTSSSAQLIIIIEQHDLNKRPSCLYYYHYCVYWSWSR